MQAKTNKLGLGILSFGHLVNDMQTSALTILIPLLYVAFKLDYAGAALIVTLNSITSSVIQPLFGLISDKKSLRWLLPVGPLFTGLGMALVLYMPNYFLVSVVVVISGLGSAAFHPEGSRNANYVSGASKATGMSVFFVGGNIGFALGPILAAILIGFWGREGMLLMLVPCLIGVFLMWRALPLYAEAANRNQQIRKAQKATIPAPKGSVAKNLTVLLSIISIRSMLQTGLTTFIPLYFVTLALGTKDYAATLLSIFLGCGAVGTLVGGTIADKIGRKTVMVVSLAVVTPLLFIFLNSSGIVQMVSIALAGGTLIAASSLTVVMAQEILPNSIGLASGLTLGLGFGAGGLGASALGALANNIGLPATMVIIALLPIPVVLLSLIMPSTKKIEAKAIEPVADVIIVQPEMAKA